LSVRRLSGAALLRRVPLLHRVLGPDAGTHHAVAPGPVGPAGEAPGPEARDGRGRR